MAYALCMGTCFGCRQPFSFNPVRVPSIRDPKTGEREPVCANCVTRANVQRKKNGLDPIVPMPDAYEPCEGGELG